MDSLIQLLNGVATASTIVIRLFALAHDVLRLVARFLVPSYVCIGGG